MEEFNFRDVTKQEPGYVELGPVFWLCKDGDPTQALFWSDYGQYNANPEVTKRYMEENMYKEIGGLKMVFMQQSYIATKK